MTGITDKGITRKDIQFIVGIIVIIVAATTAFAVSQTKVSALEERMDSREDFEIQVLEKLHSLEITSVETRKDVEFIKKRMER